MKSNLKRRKTCKRPPIKRPGYRKPSVSDHVIVEEFDLDNPMNTAMHAFGNVDFDVL